MGVHKGHHFHEGLLQQEQWVLTGVGILFFAYLLLSFFIEGSRQHLFDTFGGTVFFSQGWSVFVTIWTNNITPIFVILDIFLVFMFVFAAIKVQPYKQNMKLFRLKPHSHADHGAVHGASPAHAHAAPTVHTPQPQGNPATLKHWANIVHRANTGTVENLRWAVMEADALVDMVLKQRGVAGEGMAERLQNARWAGSKLIDKVFDAHRLRNELAHTPGFALTTHQAERALFAFRDFLKELKEF